MNPLSQRLLQEVSAEKDALTRLCQDLIRIPSVDRESDPPGDTTEICRFARGVLESAGADCKEVTVREGLPNLIAGLEGTGPGPHVVLNGHFDTFPVGDRSKWNLDPFSGEVVDGRIYGRGAIDMKGGDAAMMAAFLALAKFRGEWPGTVTLTLFSDEETGAKWGAEHVVFQCPEVRGDFILSGEPTGTGLLRFGEKGATRLTLTAHGKSGHSPVPSMGRNAIFMLMDALAEVRPLAGPFEGVPDWLPRMLSEMAPSMERAYGAGTSRHMLETTVNVGVIKGGQKDSIIPHEAEALLDIRTPFGRTHSDIMNAVEQILARHPGVECQVRHWRDPNFTDPGHPLFQTLVECAEEVTGGKPILSCALGGTDLRFWRRLGAPCAVYGPTAHNIGTENEYVEVADLLPVAQVHAITTARLLQAQ